MADQQGYADVEIRIRARRGDGYPVEITLDEELEFTGGVLHADRQPRLPGIAPAEDGQRLFDWLFADQPPRDAWTRLQDQPRRIRLRIDPEAPELHALPWETLRAVLPDASPLDLAASAATPFSRYLAGRWQPGSPILQRPVRLLVAIADPDGLEEYNLAPLDPEQEWAALERATAELRERKLVELVRLPSPCTLATLDAALREGGNLLHIVAHGTYKQPKGPAFLFLAGEDNSVHPVRDEELAEKLALHLAETGLRRDDKLRLVFLASCQTATRSPADAFHGLAPLLVQAGVPAVIAMQDLVPVDTARGFAAVFYRQLLEHGQVDLAANHARAAVLAAGRSGAAIPVLFMRLRDGRLLGKRGRASEGAEPFWPFLMRNVDRGLCLPFLGPRVNADLLPSREAIARTLAEKYGYPMPDTHDLARVAQFIAINEPEQLRSSYLELLQRSLFPALGIQPTTAMKREFRHATFTETAEKLRWGERVLGVRENTVHHLLAALDLPLYVTTNADNFMVEALKQRGRTPRREGPRWEQDRAGTPQYILSPPPSAESPVVFHLNGHDGHPEQRERLVLSEDDYLAHFVRLLRDQDTVLPSNLLGAISQHSWLFVGYDVDDWEFRVILQGLLGPIAQTNTVKKVHVGVQLEVDQNPNTERVVAYLQQYLGRFKIQIYWGTPLQFATELQACWEEYRAASEEPWY